MGNIIDGDHAIREQVEGLIAAYEDIDKRFAQAGGLEAVLTLYDGLRRALEQVAYRELEQMIVEIKQVVESLLRIDFELRRVEEMKRALGSGRGGDEPTMG